MRRSVRAHSRLDARTRLGRAVGHLPPAAQEALVTVAEREDLPLMAGAWTSDVGGCLVANVVATLGPEQAGTGHQTLDLRVLELIPELGSRDLNRLIVAWDDAALQERRVDDAALRRLLRDALDRAGLATAGRTAPSPG